MYGGSLLLLAACALPILAAPIPGHEVISPNQAVERRNDHSLSNMLDSIIKRIPSIESLPIEARADTTVEDKREEAVDEVVDEDDDELEKRGRIGKSPSNGKRGRIGGGSSNGKRGRIGAKPSNGKRGRVGKSPSNGRRGRIGGGSSNGKRGRIGKSTSNGKRSLIQRTLDIVFG